MLYYELAFIRWIPGQVRVIAYFTNFVLIACFLGIGFGMIIARRAPDTVKLISAAVLAPVLLAVLCSNIEVVSVGNTALLLVYEQELPQVSLYLLLTLFFVTIAAAMVPFGQAVGRAFGSESPLRDYIANIFGSICGILLFFIISWFSLPAWSWFLIGLPLLLVIATPESAGDGAAHRTKLVTALIGVLVVVVVWYSDRDTIWSPYHKLEVTAAAIEVETGELAPYLGQGRNTRPLPFEVGFSLRVNNDFFQAPVDLTNAVLARYPGLRGIRELYDLPYRLKPNPERVLIVGAGTGNDAAAALRNGARQVDVVEIDPEIVAIGRQHHPEQPYSDPRVTVYVDDARHFFHRADPGYDIVIFGYLDSHRLLSAMSSLRLDSFVFTVESFQEVRLLLAPSGIQLTSFAVSTPRFVGRLYEMLSLAYDQQPVILSEQGYVSIGAVLVSGPGLRELGLMHSPRPHDPETAKAVPATDDWPFFYAAAHALPREYVIALVLVALISALVLAGVSRPVRLPDAHFFFLGAGFMLLETRNITSLALVFGSTWYVNSVVFLSILIMAILSALLVLKGPRLGTTLVYLGLLAAIGCNYLLPLDRLASGGLLTRIIVAGGMTALPLLFSGIVFARSFSASTNPARALGSNILGGVLGGIVEYLGMITGLRYLLLLAALLYLLSWLAVRRLRLT